MTTPQYTQSRWSLDELFPSLSGPEIEAAFTDLEAKANAFELHRADLKPDISVDTFTKITSELEQSTRLANRLYGFAELSFAADTQSQPVQSLLARVDQFTAELSNKALFFTIWWKELDDANAERLMAAAGDLRYWLEDMRHFKQHTLSEPEEKIINTKNVTGANALNTLYDSITNRYVFKLTINGEVKELTRGELMVYARGADPELRAQAYQELYKVYGQDGPILGQIYQTLVRDWRNEQIGMRKFKSPIAARNLINDIPDEVIDTLLDVCRKNSPVFQRYFRLKARWLKMDKLRRYDLYAPVTKSDKLYSFEQAYKMVFESFNAFDPRMQQLAQRVFDKNHLDSEVRKGKQSGAFCAGLEPALDPWVKLNYQGHADDVATMAHELGHAIHAMLSNHHSVFTQHACLPLAETASTFGEMMLVDRMLQEEPDEAVRRDILFRQVDDAYGTIQRQIYFSLFERQAHDMIEKGASVDELSEAYIANLRDQFADAVDVADEFRWEWVSIPHIYNVPFYVYAYTFGQLLVMSLYKQFKAEGDSFKPRYFQILSTGGSKAPAELLAEAGIDIRQASFWQGGYDVIKDLVDQLERIPIA